MSTDLVVLQNINPLTVFTTEDAAKTILEKIKEEARKIEPDISTEAGREAIRSMAYKIAKSKTAIDKMGKDLTDEWAKKKKAVDAGRRLFWDELEALQAEVRKPLTEWENAEKLRVEEREGRIAEMSGLLTFLGHSDNGPHPLLPEIEQRLTKLQELVVFDWQEFAERAAKMQAEVNRQLTDHLEKRKKYDADQAELARLRKEEEDRKAEAERKRIAEEAAAKAKADAEAKAAEDARIAQEKADREKREADQRAADEKARADKAEADRIAAAEKHKADLKAAEEKAQKDAEAAAQKERDRQAAEKKAEEDAAAKRAADLEHKRKTNNEAVQALMTHAALDETQARAVIATIASGQVPNVKINY